MVVCSLILTDYDQIDNFVSDILDRWESSKVDGVSNLWIVFANNWDDIYKKLIESANIRYSEKWKNTSDYYELLSAIAETNIWSSFASEGWDLVMWFKSRSELERYSDQITNLGLSISNTIDDGLSKYIDEYLDANSANEWDVIRTMIKDVTGKSAEEAIMDIQDSFKIIESVTWWSRKKILGSAENFSIKPYKLTDN